MEGGNEPMSQTPTINGIGNAHPHLTTPTPEGPPRYVHRQRLNAELDAATHGPVTLVSAPAGWGKSVALSAWARTRTAGRVVWLDASAADHAEMLRLTLDRFTDGDADPAGPADVEGHRRRAGEPSRSSEPLVIVLDDCDRVADPEVLALTERIIAAHDGRLHVVLACRTDPLLPLHRWRVSGDLSEIRMDELAFTIAETAELLVNYGIQLPYSDQAELHAVTEGWPAGLRLAALAMSHSPDPAQVIADLGMNDPVSDYLTAEVLTPLPTDLREVLIELSVVEYLSAGLVRALTGRADGGPLLADIQRRGVLLRRCAGSGEWFHLHPLLGRVLYRELRQRGARDGPEAHVRAAAWYEMHGPAAETLRHLLAAEDWPRATQMLEQHWPDILVGTRWRGLKDVVGPPPDEIQARPRLAMSFAAERLEAGDPVQTHRFLRMAFGPGDRQRSPADPIAIAFDLADARFTGDVARVREVAATLLANTPTAATANGNGGAIGNNAIGTAPASGNGRLAEEARAVALVAMGAASLGLGDLREAGARLSEGLALTRQIDLARAEVAAGSRLAMWNAMVGRLQAAARLGRETLGLADRLGLMHVSDLSWARLALAEVHFQWDQLDEAHRLVEQALNDACGEPLTLIAGIIASAKVRLALGQLSEAHELLLAARQEAAHARVPRTIRRTLTLMEAELRLAAGDPPAARQRLAEWRGDEPFPAWAATVEASILLAEGRAAAAAAVVATHLAPPGPESSMTWMVQAGVLTALAGRAVGDQGRVTRGLDLALDAAEREGFRRPFVAAGHALRELINAVAPSMGVYRLVVADLGEVPDPSEYFTASATIGIGRMPRGGGPAVEPLTQRELTVLRYLQGTLSNVEIASTLHVSINTVKTHIRNIYRKLDAGRRREAVRRARDRRLL
jgi:LuxR family transcriptional regulator, maltose regulon positive regulatory protein